MVPEVNWTDNISSFSDIIALVWWALSPSRWVVQVTHTPEPKITHRSLDKSKDPPVVAEVVSGVMCPKTSAMVHYFNTASRSLLPYLTLTAAAWELAIMGPILRLPLRS